MEQGKVFEEYTRSLKLLALNLQEQWIEKVAEKEGEVVADEGKESLKQPIQEGLIKVKERISLGFKILEEELPKQFDDKKQLEVFLASFEVNKDWEKRLEKLEDIEKYTLEGGTFQDLIGWPDELLDYFYEIVKKLFEEEQMEDVIAVCTVLMFINPYVPEYPFVLAMAFDELNEWQKALEAYSLSAELEEDNPFPIGKMGECYIRLREDDKALKSFDKALEVAGERPEYADFVKNIQKILSLVRK